MTIPLHKVALRALVSLGLLLGSAGVPAVAQSAFGVVRMRIGVVSASAFRPVPQRMEPFRRLLSERLNVPVEIIPFKDGQALVDAASTRRIDYAIFSGATYAMAWRICGCFEPVAAPKATDGTAGAKAVLVVRGDSPFTKPADLAGKVLAASDQRSIIGRLVPLAELAAEGIDPETVLARIDTVKGPEAAVRAVIDKRADAALAWSTLEGDINDGYDRGTLHDLVAKRQLDMRELRIIWKSAMIPHGPHAIRADLPLALKNRLRDILITLSEDDPEAYDAVEPAFGGGFVTIGHSSYLPLLRLVTPKGQKPDQRPVTTGPAVPKG